jgi:hypothetical protein
MKNIHIIPTDKLSRLHTYKGVLNLAADEFVAPTIVKNDLINLNIYITDDSEIKEGDWVYNSLIITFAPQIHQMPNHPIKGQWWDEEELSTTKKIILTDNKDLIKDGIQAIDDEFLEWFVKNPSCENVKIESWQTKGEWNLDYKIIIPQEEPKQETLESEELYKQDIIQLIEDRILSEYKKHSSSLPNEWAKIAAHKIYKSISDKME